MRTGEIPMMLSANPKAQAFRRSAIVASTTAALFFLPNFAFAQDQKAPSTTVATQGPPACEKYAMESSQRTKCIFDEWDKRIARTEKEATEAHKRGTEADRRGAEADKRAAEAVIISECVKYLTAGVVNGSFNKAEILTKAGGKLNDANACPIARTYGFGRKADASPKLNAN
jgi:hypothetical protein